MLDARRQDDHPERPSQTLGLESMTSPDLAIAEPEVCPFLGLPDDPRTRFTFADPAHRCHVGAKPTPIDLGHQGAYCLTAGYPACERFRSPRKAERPASGPAPSSGATIAAGAAGGAVVPVAIAAADATVSQDGGTSRGKSRALRRTATLDLVAVLALVMLIGAVVVGAFGGFKVGGGAHGVVASPSSAATPAPTAVTSAPTATPTAVSRSTSAPTATPAPTGTPRSVSVIHVVVRGETLSSIAAHFGVTAKAIQDANKIVDPSVILVGDRLVIPPPP
jgi:LysM repeat protein